MTSFNSHMGDYVSNTTKKGWLTSILELGAWTGTLYSGFLAEIISRKYAIIVNTVVFILGVIIQCTAVSAGHSAILGGRFVVSKSIGHHDTNPSDACNLIRLVWVLDLCR